MTGIASYMPSKQTMVSALVGACALTHAVGAASLGIAGVGNSAENSTTSDTDGTTTGRHLLGRDSHLYGREMTTSEKAGAVGKGLLCAFWPPCWVGTIVKMSVDVHHDSPESRLGPYVPNPHR